MTNLIQIFLETCRSIQRWKIMQIAREFREFERLQGIFGKAHANWRGAETPTNVVKGLNDDTHNAIDVGLELDKMHTSAILMENHLSNRPNVSKPQFNCQKSVECCKQVYSMHGKLHICSKI